MWSEFQLLYYRDWGTYSFSLNSFDHLICSRRKAPRLDPRLTIIITTVGRPSVVRTLQSLEKQKWQAGDQILLVCDGPIPRNLCQLWLNYSLPCQLMFIPEGPHRDWGHTPRNLALKYATGDYIAHLDDDDCFQPDSISAIRELISERGRGLYFFQMQLPDGQVLWKQREVRFGNVGTPMFVHPRTCNLGEWGSFYGGDWQFMHQTTTLNPDLSIFWIPRVICLIRPIHA